MGKVLGIVYCTVATHLPKKAGFTKTTSQTGCWYFDAQAMRVTVGWL